MTPEESTVEKYSSEDKFMISYALVTLRMATVG